MNTETKQCESCKRKLTIEPEDSVFYERFGIPAPDECPRCIWRRLLAFWVFGKFRKTKSALSGKTIITTFGEEIKFPLYDRTEWVSDSWDPMQYGKEYDLSRPFFEQFKELQDRVPHPQQSGTNNFSSDWCDDVWNSKNCYLTRSLLDCEDLYYGYRNIRCKNSVDLVFCFDMDLSYDCTYCFKCYNVRHSFDARDSIESAFLYDCRNVQNCFMCWNLRNKQYHILNKPYSKEAYFEELKKYNLRSRKSVEAIKKEFPKTLAREAVYRSSYNVKTTSSTGNFLEECKNCYDCYFIEYSENNRHMFRGGYIKDSIHGVGTIVEKALYSVVDNKNYDTIATLHCDSCRYSAYLDYCEESEYCFGCVSLRKKKYCILNKQYSEAEYKTLLPKIKESMIKTGEWGKFFPYSMAYGGYNFSIANTYFPSTKEELEAMGGIWVDRSEASSDGASGDILPDVIDDASEDISRKQIVCPRTGWRFNIAPGEFQFYKAQGIPLPQDHFDVRILNLFKPLAAIELFSGRCFFCKKDTTHYYPHEWEYQKIACAECYQREVS
ncbi:MAG: hypothetical protein UY56_C0012G0003 [Parcubacteria group bacterium GW2011_GWA1_50_14]|nr:MAG: hypothetical protein UY56_C0012G0003 [Parcubacteria group bacterium GW2011_GWA1_50_14]